VDLKRDSIVVVVSHVWRSRRMAAIRLIPARLRHLQKKETKFTNVDGDFELSLLQVLEVILTSASTILYSLSEIKTFD
jgi:hypothetical protein